MNYGRAYREAGEMQQVLFTTTLDASTAPKDKAACARAWDVLQDRKREIRGKPKAGVFKAERPKPKEAPHCDRNVVGFDPSDSANGNLMGRKVHATATPHNSKAGSPAEIQASKVPWQPFASCDQG
jgi:hypothetical protein